jgi:hypothetical protein
MDGAGAVIRPRCSSRPSHARKRSGALTGEAYAVIDGTDGRAHYVRLRGIEAFAQAPPAGGIVDVRRFGSRDDPRPTLVLANRSDIDLGRQAAAPGATWLDYRLVERERMPLAMGGFGQEVRDAMVARPSISPRKVLPTASGPASSRSETSSPRRSQRPLPGRRWPVRLTGLHGTCVFSSSTCELVAQKSETVATTAPENQGYIGELGNH